MSREEEENNNNNNNNSKRDDGSLLRSESCFVLRWGCRKRLRCIKDRGGTNNNEPPGSSRPLRKRSAYPSPRVLRNSDMRERITGVRSLDDSPDRKGTSYNNNNHNDNNHSSGGSGSSECDRDTIGATWPPNFVIGLTNKEKEEDYMAIKGSKLPQRPKKRTKFIQRTLNLVSPGAWLRDLSLDRYEVREKKVSKKRPRARGLKGMGNNMNIDSDSE